MAANNVPPSIEAKLGRQLHRKPNHPISIVKNLIYGYFRSTYPGQFREFDDLPQVVSTQHNFDWLEVPADHPSRSRRDTYYVDAQNVLRTHTSAHQNQLLSEGHRQFLVTGDVYRRDEINRTHYNVFHQMEGVWVLDDMSDQSVEMAIGKLKEVLGGLLRHLFPDLTLVQFEPTTFPFTHPSFEVNIKYGESDNLLEILGSGVMQPAILRRWGIASQGIAWGLGLERLAMLLFKIPDIRLFWTGDERFHQQFTEGQIITFKPYARARPFLKDVSFYVDKSELIITGSSASAGSSMGLNEIGAWSWGGMNDFNEWVRGVCGDSIESVALLDQYYNAKKDRYSVTFRMLIDAADIHEANESKVTEHANACIKMIIADLIQRGYVIR